MKNTYFIALAILIASAGAAYATVSGYISDYQGIKISDGSSYTILEKNNHLYLQNDMDGSEVIISGLTDNDGSYIDIIHK